LNLDPDHPADFGWLLFEPAREKQSSGT